MTVKHAEALRSQRRRREADCAMANVSLLAGDKARAKELFTRCLEKGDPINFYYVWNSVSELEALKR